MRYALLLMVFAIPAAAVSVAAAMQVSALKVRK